MYPTDRRALLRSTAWFFLCVGALLFLGGLRYLWAFPWPDAWLARGYALGASVGQFWLMGMAPWVLLVLPLVLIFPAAPLVRGVCIVSGAALVAFVQIDGLVFAADRFHLTPLAIRVLGAPTWTFTALYFAVGLVLCRFLLRLASRRWAAPGAGVRAAGLCAVLLAIFGASQLMHAWADVRYYVPITSFTPFLPLYRPFTSKHLLSNWISAVDLERARQGQDVEKLADVQDGVLDYPKAPLTCNTPAAPLNVLIIGLDAMRSDMVNPRVAPHIAHFAESALRFSAHWSGGNGTRPGLFSLFYGIPSTYYSAFYAAQRPPVLIETFQAKGYEVGVFPSNPADHLVGLERTAFRSVPNLPTTVGDPAVTEGWLHFLQTRDRSRPFFGFLFYESAPGACLPGYEKVSDVPFDTPGDAGRLACYETAVHFGDGQVGRVLDAVEAAGLLDNTVVIVTSDHGEEFNENGQGFRGHGSSYSSYQLHTPMVVHWPGRESATIERRTSHHDVSPTLLTEVLGCTNPPSDYSSGKNMFSDESWQWLVAASYTSHAIVQPDQVTVSYGSYYEVRDQKGYKLVDEPKLDSDVLARAIRETGRFIRK